MKLFITKRAAHELDHIPDSIAKNITKHILSLSTIAHPPNSKKLQGKDNFRLRVGSFRVIYTVDAKQKGITILRVADRKTIYR
ncbi:type II toxin-antitoxin system RelE/ParE family toxin [Patescibacteria group bacterium]|nr:type II toxin-antitoxin system RelE/ParE family toxin [Patescibacteria group bacterium]MBU1472864.1 type II toxin-antitoxin system RelE/ParE family toxin [Patescibacteria group bacterium]MBU2459521.1 type II toxin-antitoxin system RelE/ParE family toxin [Patescibacteria group bacterium]MBU2543970.1 type II toxin-antitoxin system RelE/ParE family toxin [Patescibacteria group bacterium]